MAARFLARRANSKDIPTATQSNRPTSKYRFEGHENAVEGFVFLHDNIHIVSGSWDGTMRKWNCDTGLVVGEPWRGEGGGIYALALSPDGKTIACGREDGSVERWNTDGEMMEGVWTGHGDRVQSLSWSPSGRHIASGSHDEIILIRDAESGEVEVDPIDTKQIHVFALAYSPSGDRIASGGETFGKTICIWDSTTGSLVVTIKGLGMGSTVTSLVWSPDNSKLYSAASDKFTRVFDSTSGKLLHRFKHCNTVNSVALSPHNNVLACVGEWNVAQLWDAESHQPLGQPFCQSQRQYFERFYCVTFSRDGRYVAYGGDYGELTLWTVDDIAPEPTLPILPQGQLGAVQQETRPQTNLQREIGPDPEHENRPDSPISSCLDADATGGGGIMEDMRDDPYNNFFMSSQTSLPAATSSPTQPHNPFSARRFWNMISRHYLPTNESDPLRERPKRKFLARRARSNSPLQPEQTTPNQPALDGKAQAVENDEEDERDDLGVSKSEKDKGKQRDESFVNAQSPPPDDHAAKFESAENCSLWKRLLRTRRKNPTSVNMAPAMKRPEVVEVYAVRGFQGYVAMTPKRRRGSSSATFSTPQLGAAHTGGSSQSSPSSPTGVAQAGTLLQASSWQEGPSFPAIAGRKTQYVRAVGGSSSYTSPSRFGTYHADHDSDSDSIQGSCHKFLDKICYPRGRFHNDS
ncbi:WD40-repeat-containing domain protein [Suillus clintonianus]|uniref:WD40-repeat-containing domain protein n=1 Tax=Suillus clintonianus TaxID=1904413 RepID=UPI001B8807D0|nr:WD40-repeat-containing domain protein [Suillus clintonianus]KAG2146236.1 WD40-repeat-containing domain protein [Suillus clintonianus]